MYKILNAVAINLAVIITLDTIEKIWLKWRRHD